MIICGFAGIGKSHLAHNSQWVDLESTPFNKNWDLYSDVAIHMDKNGYNVMLSCHSELREMLKSKNAKYSVVMPIKEQKSEYIKRYKERGNDKSFIKLFDDNFDKFIDDIKSSKDDIYLLFDGMYLSDIADSLVTQ